MELDLNQVLRPTGQVRVMVTYHSQKTEDCRDWINVRLSIRNLAQEETKTKVE